MRLKFIKLFAIILTFSLFGISTAQQELAAVLEVTYSGVEVRRANTQSWIAIPDNAVMPIGSGDTVRTDRYGRVLITVDNRITALVLPFTEYTIESIDDTSSGLEYRVELLDGTTIHRVNNVPDFEIDTGEMIVLGAEGEFATWAAPPILDVVTVREGSVRIERLGGAFTVLANQGFRYHPTNPEIRTMDAPLNRARLDAQLDGCTGVVKPRVGASGLQVYTGAGTAFNLMGSLDGIETVEQFAQTRSEFWTRIQFGNQFGWVIADAISPPLNCFLRSLPDSTIERNILRIVAGDERELALLEPYFGIPDEQVFFYPSSRYEWE